MFSTATLQPGMGDEMVAPARYPSNPWVSDRVLLSLSLWWVESTREQGADLPAEVGVVFRSLQQQLQ